MNQSRRLPLGVAAIAACVWSGVARGDDADAADVNVRAPKRRGTRAPKDSTVAGEVIERDEIDAPGRARRPTSCAGIPACRSPSPAGRARPRRRRFAARPPRSSPSTSRACGSTTTSRGPPIFRGCRSGSSIASRSTGATRRSRPTASGSGARCSSSRAGPADARSRRGAMVGSFGERGAWTYGALGDRDASVLVGRERGRGDERLPVRERPRDAPRAHGHDDVDDDERRRDDLRRVGARPPARVGRGHRRVRERHGARAGSADARAGPFARGARDVRSGDRRRTGAAAAGRGDSRSRRRRRCRRERRLPRSPRASSPSRRTAWISRARASRSGSRSPRRRRDR